MQRGYGIADLASGRALADTTPVNIASLTKPFTAAVVQMLAAEKRIRSTHRPAIADDPDAAEYRRRLDSSQVSAPPGERFEYSNTGYTVLGWLVDSVQRIRTCAKERKDLEPQLGLR